MAERLRFTRALVAAVWRGVFAPASILLVASMVMLVAPTENADDAVASTFLSRTFGNTGTGSAGGTTNNSSGTLGSAPTVSSGYYTWTVPASGRYQLLVEGAQGGTKAGAGYTAGAGTSVTTEWNLTAGQSLQIYVGQQGGSSTYAGGGGGASGVFATSGSPATILSMAGGGGGAGWNFGGNNAGTSSSGGASGGRSGGSGGNGGPAGWYSGDCGIGAGGGGYLTNGSSNDGSASSGPVSGNTNGGKSHANGGAGGTVAVCGTPGPGGFGAAGGGAGAYGGGGGGGYSGGAGGQYRYLDSRTGGGGGGSYAAGALSATISGGSRTGHGNVVITLLAPAPTTFSTQAASPSNATSLDYDVVFSESVTGLDVDDFAVSGTSAGWSVSSVAGSGTTYVVTVDSPSPTTGTVVLTMLQNAVYGTSTQQNGPGGDTAAATMNIDVDPPGASVSSVPSSPAAAVSLTFGMSFTESVSGI
ncbi:MAG: hypothetical protein ACO3RB_05395, partial [Ilumatobacteraceae bacterium]